MAVEDQTNSTGTGRLLHEWKNFTEIKEEYDVDVAAKLTAKAIQKKDPSVTASDVVSADKVITALMSGNVSIADEQRRAEEKAKKAAAAVFLGNTSPEEA